MISTVLHGWKKALFVEKIQRRFTFGKLKHYRRIATRYEKKAIDYMEMLSFSPVLLWLR
jgi:transposase